MPKVKNPSSQILLNVHIPHWFRPLDRFVPAGSDRLWWSYFTGLFIMEMFVFCEIAKLLCQQNTRALSMGMSQGAHMNETIMNASINQAQKTVQHKMEGAIPIYCEFRQQPVCFFLKTPQL